MASIDTPCLWWDNETGKVYGIKHDGQRVEYLIKDYGNGLAFVDKSVWDKIESRLQGSAEAEE